MSCYIHVCIPACLPVICFCSILSSQIDQGKFEFFPLLQARCLETEENDTAKQLETLRSMVTSVLERFKEEVLHSNTDYWVQQKHCIIYYNIALSLQEHEKVQRYRRQEQEKWEEKVLKGHGSLSGSV